MALLPSLPIQSRIEFVGCFGVLRWNFFLLFFPPDGTSPTGRLGGSTHAPHAPEGERDGEGGADRGMSDASRSVLSIDTSRTRHL